jgi:hypothetical protein
MLARSRCQISVASGMLSHLTLQLLAHSARPTMPTSNTALYLSTSQCKDARAPHAVQLVRKAVTAFVVQLGGMGFLHYNCSIKEQVAMAVAVKTHRLGCIVNPLVMLPSTPIGVFLESSVRSSPAL